MADSWTVASYMTALRDLLRLRPGLSGIQIMSAPVKLDEVEDEAIVFIDAISEDDTKTLGDRSREEKYTIEGVVQVLMPGSGEDDAVAARDRAAALLAEVERQVRATPDAGLNSLGNQEVRFSEILQKNLRQRIQEDHRRAVIEFDIQVATRI